MRAPTPTHPIRVMSATAGSRLMFVRWSNVDRQPPAPAGEASTAPRRGGLVLISLILVAAVANLNLAVANVALPDIGKAFDAGADRAQPRRRRLLARAGGLGALPRRARRPLRAQADAASSARRWRSRPRCSPPSRRRSRCSSSPASLGGLAAGMAYPTTLALITALWSGPARTQVDRALVGARRRDLGARPAARRARCSSEFEWGSVFLITLPLAAVALVLALQLRARPRQRGHRSGRQPRRHPLGRARRRARARRSTSRRCRRGHAGARARGDRGRGRVAFLHPPAPGASTRSTTWTSPGGGSSGSRPAPGSSCSAR